MNEKIITIEKSLRQSDFIIRKKGREILKDYDITPPQFRALQVLVSHDDCMFIGELSDSMQLACSTITDLVNRMEKVDLVRKIRDDKDGRMVRIEVQEKGHAIMREVLRTRQEYLEKTLENLSDEDLTRLAESLTMLIGELKKD